jgi:autotransporter-associated beta strand protein
VFGGLVGSTDLASMVAAGYGSVTSLTLNPNAGFTRTYSGVIANGAAGMGLTKSGPGTQVLEAASTYTGPTSVTGGALTLAAGGSIDASPVVTVGDGAIFDVSAKVGGYVVPASQTLAGSGTVVGPVVVGGGATLSPGSGPGTLSFAGDLSWNAAGNYNWQMLSGTGVAGAADSWDLVNVTGALSIAATSADPFRINLWTLTGTSPGVSGPASNFDPSQNYNWRIASAAGGISGFAADKFLISTSATNGTGGFANTTYGGTFSMIQSGNDLELVFTSSGTGMVITIHVESGTQTQTQAGYPLLSGDTPVVKTGAGTLVVDQANTLSGSTTVQGGVLQLANGSALSASRLVVVAGGTGQVAPVTATSVASLDLASGNGLMDLTSGALTISSGLTATELVAEILEGRGDGSWTGSSGITSSTAAAESAAGTPRAVGWIDNGDGSLTTAYAAPGDTNIDWSIDILDAANFLSGGKFDTGSPAIWFEGDFSYDGIVDILDAADFFATGLYDAGSYNTAPGLSGGIAAVPEPATWTLLACGLGLLAASGRRRRR